MPDKFQAQSSGADLPPETDLKLNELTQTLRRKEGNWISWGQACQQLQKSGRSPQSIFEDTGFEPIHQNQVIVGAQVYTTLAAANVPDELLAYYEVRGSDILYELRILNQTERAAAAALIKDKQLNAEDAKDVAKAIKEFSLIGDPPSEFTDQVGDIIAYRYWKLARQQEDLQKRSHLIAQGLKFAHTNSARGAIEQLLTDFTITKEQPAPPLPLYRLESETELPRILPYLGKLPLSQANLESVAPVDVIGPFQQVQSQKQISWVALPGWQVILQAHDPIALTCDSDQLPTPLPDQVREELLVIIDRAQKEWKPHSYFVTANDQTLDLRWFIQAPNSVLLGQVILILRPKKILDENYTKELWQIDE